MDWDRFDLLVRIADRFGVCPLLAVIPENRDPDLLKKGTHRDNFWPLMKSFQARGWEIAVHGFQHLYSTYGTGYSGVASKSEFVGRSYVDQLASLTAATAIFRREGLTTRTFVAPSHSFDDQTIDALKTLGFQYISDGYALYPYQYRGITFIPQLFERPIAWPIGVHTIVLHHNEMKEADFARLESFLSVHSHRCVRFLEAAELPKTPWRIIFNALSRPCLRSVVVTKRRLSAPPDPLRKAG